MLALIREMEQRRGLPVQTLAPSTVPPPNLSGLTALSGVSITNEAGEPILISA